jgi:hypothetical protein
LMVVAMCAQRLRCIDTYRNICGDHRSFHGASLCQQANRTKSIPVRASDWRHPTGIFNVIDRFHEFCSDMDIGGGALPPGHSERGDEVRKRDPGQYGTAIPTTSRCQHSASGWLAWRPAGWAGW